MNPWMHVTGWALIHSVWQGGLLTLATAAGLRWCRGRSPRLRYMIACAGLTAMLVVPVATAFVWTSPSELVSGRSRLVPVLVSDVTNAEARPSSGDARWFRNGPPRMPAIRIDAWLPVVVWSWLVGVIGLMTRLGGGCWRVHRIRVATGAAAASPWQAAGEQVAARLSVTVAFHVVESARVEVPTVLGWLRPVILLPLTVVTNLAPGQIEALLAHELAHIRRHDYAVNLVQTVADTLLFYHPGAWWVSARIRDERELCCDDVAVEVCGEPAAYAAALVELASWHTRDAALGVAATDGPLLARVRRLLRVPEDRATHATSGLAFVALGLLLAAGVAVQSTAARVTSGAPGLGMGAASLAAFSPLDSHELPLVGPIQRPATPDARVKARATIAAGQSPAAEWRARQADHVVVYYPPDLDLHAERVEREAEQAYAQVSADLKHDLAGRVPIFLFRTTRELEQSGQASWRVSLVPVRPPDGSAVTLEFITSIEPTQDRILLAMDRPADQWFGLLTHEVTHVFGFDIVPGLATPRWISEGLAEYERGVWDPDDLVALRDAVRTRAVPQLSALTPEVSPTTLVDGTLANPRLVYALGHVAFDFIEARWGKVGVRQFLFWLRQTAASGGDPYEGALQISREAFDQAFAQYVTDRFARSVGRSVAERDGDRATLSIDGEIFTTKTSVPTGLACLELLVVAEEGIRQRWGVECVAAEAHDVMQIVRPGDRVRVSGWPAGQPATSRLVMHGLVRPSDGFTWHAPPDLGHWPIPR